MSTENTQIGSVIQEIDTTVKNLLSPRPMKICIVCNPGMGGSGIVGTAVASGLSSNGHDVHIVSYNKPFRLDDRRIGRHFIPTRQYPALQYFPVEMATASKVYDVVKKNGVELINVHYAIPHSVASYLAREMFKSEDVKLPIVTTVHGTDIHTIGQKKEFKSILRFSLKSSDGITAVSNYLANQIKNKFDVEQEVKVIYNHVDTKKFRKNGDTRLRQRLGGGKKILLHTSNFRPIKNIDDIIDSFKIVRKTVPSKLVLVGEGPEKARLRKKVTRMRLSGDVIFAGARKDVEKYYAAADVFMFSSVREGFGMAVLEAMSSSVPVVSTNVGGVGEIVEDGKTGHLVRLGDTEKMADRTVDILTNDRKRDKMGKTSRKKVLSEFTAAKIIPQYENYYRKMLLS